jgi:hypothetical protein
VETVSDTDDETPSPGTIWIEHVDFLCTCSVGDDGAIFVRLPCLVRGTRVTKHRVGQLRHAIKRKS